jgi:hypothetical protein
LWWLKARKTIKQKWFGPVSITQHRGKFNYVNEKIAKL